MSDEGEEGGHGDKPWVYFMIDSFFLVTQFFVLTFKVRADEVVLPQKLPPGGGSGASAKKDMTPKETIIIEVASSAAAQSVRNQIKQQMENGGTPEAIKALEEQYASIGDLYSVGGQNKSQRSLLQSLLDVANTKGGDKVSVRVKYEKDVPFGDVLSIFNVCNRAKIGECGLIPLRGVQE